MALELLQAVPLVVSVPLLVYGFIHYFLKMRWIPQVGENMALAFFLIGLITTAGSAGMLSGFLETADTTSEGEFQYSVTPAAIHGATYDSSTGMFSTTQTYNTTSDTLDKDNVTMEFSISREDQSTDASVLTVSVEDNPEMENETSGDSYKLFEETSDDKIKCKIEDSNGDFAYESRNIALDPVEGSSTATVTTVCHLQNDLPQYVLNEFPDEPYESDQAVISVAGKDYTYKEVLESVVS